MASFNQVILMGNLTRDPDLKYSQSGTALCNIDLAVNEPSKKDSPPLYIRIIAFNKQAESAAQYLKRGSAILVQGKLQISSWEGEGGVKKTRPEVLANMIQFLSSRTESDDQEQAPKIDIRDSDIPF